MRVIDNSPIDVPAVGRLVKEMHATNHLADCCLYVLPSNNTILAESGKKVFDELLASVGDNQLLNKYYFEELNKMPPLDNLPRLNNAIKEEQCQFLMALFTPSKTDKQYLLLKTEQEKLYSDIALMFYTSERISKHSVNELLFQYAINDPENFSIDIGEEAKSERFWKNYFASIANEMPRPSFGMRASLPKIKEVLKIDGTITYKKKQEMKDRMMENIYKYRRKRDKKAEAELNCVLKSLDVESMKAILLKMPKKQLESFCKTANDKRQAEESTMSLEIKYEGKIDHKYKTRGKYRLFLLKDCDSILVNFGRREAFILYLIYLIDKHERDDVDSIKIKSYRNQFVNLYEEVYGKGDDAGAIFDRMVNNYDEEGNARQSQIKHSYDDIRSAIIDGCEKLRELPSPFILADAQDHLDVLKDKITIPQKLIDITKG